MRLRFATFTLVSLTVALGNAQSIDAYYSSNYS